jgi:hypothetical protein
MFHAIVLLAALTPAPARPSPQMPCFDSARCSRTPYACFANENPCASVPIVHFVTVTIEADDSVTVANRRIPLNDLPKAFHRLATLQRTEVSILADARAHYGTVKQVLDDAKAAGLRIHHSTVGAIPISCLQMRGGVNAVTTPCTVVSH